MRADHHRIARLLVQHGLERQVVAAVEAREPHVEAALPAGNLEAERYAVVLEGGHALGRGGGQLEAPHRKRRDHAGRMRRGLREVHHRCEMSPT